ARGQLGDGTTTNRLAPVDVIGISGAAAVAAADGHTCTILSGGAVECWGDRGAGQLGDGFCSFCLTPQNVVGLLGDSGFPPRPHRPPLPPVGQRW
ncbi:hypothetical protein, partial [Dokdonella sp.]|uniref:hypothetical protein n=1 Tax=Dokdonella sp. TaxID=2291710 RepID=UPI0027B96C42